MTDLETARVLGKSDAFEIAYQISKLSEAASRRSVAYLSFRKSIENIMTSTMSILSSDHAALFDKRENREAYYRSFEQQMRTLGLVQEDFHYAPEGDYAHAVPR